MKLFSLLPRYTSRQLAFGLWLSLYNYLLPLAAVIWLASRLGLD